MTTDQTKSGSIKEVFFVFLGLGLTSFGGPVAHIGYFREAFVVRHRWIGDRAYADLVALCQFLPGPASSQVGMAIGLIRAGYGGMLAAWLAFTLPSALFLVAFAYGIGALESVADVGWIAGLKAAAVGVVAHAIFGMARSLTPDKESATIAVLGMIGAMLIPSAAGQVLVIVFGALMGLAWLQPRVDATAEDEVLTLAVGRRTAITCFATFFILLMVLPILAAGGDGLIRLVDSFYRAGALVFGGGHVVLPLLQAEVVDTGWVDRDTFLAGYGAAQAIPGPLFTFAAYLGASMQVSPSGLTGALVALIAIFLPSALLVVGGLPFWNVLRSAPRAQRAIAGVNAAVVGLLAAAFYDPVFTQGVSSPVTMAIAAGSFVALAAWAIPAWAVVVAAGLLGFIAL